MSRKLLPVILFLFMFLVCVHGAVIYVNSTNCSTQFKKVKPGDIVVFVNGTYSNATCGPIDAYNITFELYNNTTEVFWNGPLLLINNNTTVTNFYYNFFPYNLSATSSGVSGFQQYNTNGTSTNLEIEIISPLNSNCILYFNYNNISSTNFYLFGQIISNNSSLYFDVHYPRITGIYSNNNIIIQNSTILIVSEYTNHSIQAKKIVVNNSHVTIQQPINISNNLSILNSFFGIVYNPFFGTYNTTFGNISINNSTLWLYNVSVNVLNNTILIGSNFRFYKESHIKSFNLYIYNSNISFFSLQTLNNSTLQNYVLNTSFYIDGGNLTIYNSSIGSVNITVQNHGFTATLNFVSTTTLENIQFISTVFENTTTSTFLTIPSFIKMLGGHTMFATNLTSNSKNLYNLTIDSGFFSLFNSSLSTQYYLSISKFYVYGFTLKFDNLSSNYLYIGSFLITGGLPGALYFKIFNSYINASYGEICTGLVNNSTIYGNNVVLRVFNISNSVVYPAIAPDRYITNITIYNSSIYNNISSSGNISISYSKLYGNINIIALSHTLVSPYYSVSVVKIYNSVLNNATILANTTNIYNITANNITIKNVTKYISYPFIKILDSNINYLFFDTLNNSKIYVNNIISKLITLTNSTVSNLNISASGNLIVNKNTLGNTYIKNNNITLTNNNINATNVVIQMLNNSSKILFNYDLINTSSLTLTTFSMYPNFTGFVKLENTTFKVLNPHLIPFQLNYNYYIYNVTLNSESILNGNVTNTSAYEIIMFNNGTCSNLYNVTSNVTFGCGNISDSNITLIYTPFNNISVSNSDFAEIVAKNSSVTITNSKVYYYHFPSVYALYNNFSIIANYLNVNGLDCEINKSCILFSDANGTINNSKLCPTNDVSLGIVNTSQNFYVYDSYFDNLVLVPNYNIYNISVIPVDQLINYILDYPDSNYYCNGTPRFTVTTTKTNVTNVTKTVVYVNIPIQVSVPGDLAKTTPAFGFKLLMIFVTFFIPILFLVIAFLTTLAESKK